MTSIHTLDLIGVFAFAIYGARRAIMAKFDLFGVLLCAALTAVGGGTIREAILHGTPAYLHDYSYGIAIVVGVFCAIAIHDYFRKLEKYLLRVDAIGVAVFAYIGARRADEAGLGLLAMVLFAVLTAVGGGTLTDVITRRKPEALYKDFYPLAAIVLATGYYLVRPAAREVPVALALIALAFAVRLASLQFKCKLWRPYNGLRIKLKLPVWRRRLAPEAE
ncbi:MAG TPA: TRIC cation channel family protein [Candidatus Saccharimonadales bacterium]|nr:TRIC cation channel family protein [Candidatus Saccharimonadales bacterium]